MADIFLSYSSLDRAHAHRFQEALAKQGHDVFWDQQVPTGRTWDEWIRTQLRSAKLVVVLWSKNSAASNNVLHEARLGYKYGKLFPVLIDDIEPDELPMGFYAIQAPNLQPWLLGNDKSIIDKVLNEIGTRLPASEAERLSSDEPAAQAPVPPEFSGDPSRERTWRRYVAARDNIERRFGKPLEHALANLARVEGQWDAIYAEVLRYPSYARPWIYWPFVAALTLLEVPVNRLSFELIFRESTLLSIVVAMMIGAVQIFLAHTVGVTARRLSYAVEQRQWANPGISRSLAAAPHMLAIALSLFFILANSYGLAVFRQAFLQFVNQPDPSLEQLINDDQATAYVMIGSSLAVEGWIFLFINLGIVGVAIMGAFFSHDPHPDYALVDRLLKRASKTVEQLQINRGKSIAFAEQMVADAGGEDRS